MMTVWLGDIIFAWIKDHLSVECPEPDWTIRCGHDDLIGILLGTKS